MNTRISRMYCIQCGTVLETGDYPYGCPNCLKAGRPSSVSFHYDGEWEAREGVRGMKRYARMLPCDDFPSLGEGNTPLISIPPLADQYGVKELWFKNEFQNPTGSHKDRMNPFIVARAKETGHKVVAAASSGNEGVSLACYAALAGIECKIVGTNAINPIWRAAIISAGAELIITPTASGRWTFLREKMETEGWLSATNVMDPPVGSCCFGLQGYKTISYELYEEMEILPDYIMVPVARGDLLWGIYEGFAELKAAGRIGKIPHLIAVEPFPRIETINGVEECRKNFEGEYEKTPSIGGTTVTVQSVTALRESGGFAVSVPQDLVEPSIRELGGYGLYLESSSALPIACLRKLRQEGTVPEGAGVLVIATSHGFKNPPEMMLT